MYPAKLIVVAEQTVGYPHDTHHDCTLLIVSDDSDKVYRVIQESAAENGDRRHYIYAWCNTTCPQLIGVYAANLTLYTMLNYGVHIHCDHMYCMMEAMSVMQARRTAQAPPQVIDG